MDEKLTEEPIVEVEAEVVEPEEKQENRLVISNSIVKILPLMVKEALSKMPENKQLMFAEEYKRRKKSTGLAYFFTLLCLGIPYGYLGKWGLQIVYWLTGAGLGIWLLYLIFAIPGMVRNYNRDVACQVLRDLSIIG
ncbi:MAG: TM2 domain-containing protein [Prevotella sp.]|nr:TM2 domain-containing protein [Prevotella sp.]